MKDPVRWLDDDADAPAGARELLAAARPTAGPDPSVLERSAAELSALEATTPRDAAFLRSLATAAAVLLSLPIGAKLAAAAAAVAVATVVVVQVVPTAPAAEAPAAASRAKQQRAKRARSAPAREARAKAPAEVPSVIAEAPIAPIATPVPVNAPASEPAPVLATPRKPRSARTEPSAATQAASLATPAAPEPDALAQEVSWLDQARALLATSPAAALARADAHAQRFAKPALVAERELIAIDALLRLGQRAEAKARADRLLTRFPASMYRERLQRLLDGR